MKKKLSSFLDGMFSFVGSFNPDYDISLDPDEIYYQTYLSMQEPWKLIGQAMNDTIRLYKRVQNSRSSEDLNKDIRQK